ncbi:filament-like plant protein [Anaeramoeba ignava]|uniref:Filament-like plant protein n=1 Tax=Anaeramoeba ignava TaxID=1746090 RepID=A0A9Q0RC56_ANAIG|nr:filament-like plant protein [Anaeramoeba ignava]|eukprot:Anaeramoba_ignava/a480984_92.p1 GENE.a480984_92~~a480984_92.p1  ORF type:complete len:276 (-),score=85.84 a480984_92:25-804(-)
MGQKATKTTKVSRGQLKSYMKMIHYSKEAICLVKPDGYFIDFNQPFMEIWEAKSREQLFALTPGILAPPFQPHMGMDSQSAMEKVIGTAIKSETGFHDFDFLQTTVDGKEFWAHVWLKFVRVDKQDACQAIMKRIENPMESYQKQEISDKYLNLNLQNDTSDTSETPSLAEMTRRFGNLEDKSKELKKASENLKSLVLPYSDEKTQEISKSIESVLSLSQRNSEVNKKITQAQNLFNSLKTKQKEFFDLITQISDLTKN